MENVISCVMVQAPERWRSELTATQRPDHDWGGTW